MTHINQRPSCTRHSPHPTPYQTQARNVHTRTLHASRGALQHFLQSSLMLHWTELSMQCSSLVRLGKRRHTSPTQSPTPRPHLRTALSRCLLVSPHPVVQRHRSVANSSHFLLLGGVVSARYLFSQSLSRAFKFRRWLQFDAPADRSAGAAIASKVVALRRPLPPAPRPQPATASPAWCAAASSYRCHLDMSLAETHFAPNSPRRRGRRAQWQGRSTSTSQRVNATSTSIHHAISCRDGDVDVDPPCPNPPCTKTSH